jgi:hypothetical protein
MVTTVAGVAPKSMKYTAQLSSLRSRLRGHAGEYDLLPLVVADLSEENLECAPLVLTSRPHVATVNGECNRFRHHRRLGSRPRDSLLLQPGANTKGSLPGGLHGLCNRPVITALLCPCRVW